jgi:hypothetical protein
MPFEVTVVALCCSLYFKSASSLRSSFPLGRGRTQFSALQMTTSRRIFHLIRHGEGFTSKHGRPTIGCDGRISGGVSLELSHWPGNVTPDHLYADTSTEMALKLPVDVYPNAVVLNNHYDTDGVLSVFACLEPLKAKEYASLLKEGAEAGDFGEWSSDVGIKLDATIGSYLLDGTNEAAAYESVLRELPEILFDFSKTGGMRYQEVWAPALEHAYRSWEAVQDGSASIERDQSIAIVSEPSSFSLSSFAVHKWIGREGVGDKVERILRVTRPTTSRSSLFQYVYEKPGHGWVQKLVDRPLVPPVDASKLVDHLNDALVGGAKKWKTGGPSGMVGICTSDQIQVAPDQVASCLADVENALLMSKVMTK